MEVCNATTYQRVKSTYTLEYKHYLVELAAAIRPGHEKGKISISDYVRREKRNAARYGLIYNTGKLNRKSGKLSHENELSESPASTSVRYLELSESWTSQTRQAIAGSCVSWRVFGLSWA